jgi:hypothetical protein
LVSDKVCANFEATRQDWTLGEAGMSTCGPVFDAFGITAFVFCIAVCVYALWRLKPANPEGVAVTECSVAGCRKQAVALFGEVPVMGTRVDLQICHDHYPAMCLEWKAGRPE